MNNFPRNSQAQLKVLLFLVCCILSNNAFGQAVNPKVSGLSNFTISKYAFTENKGQREHAIKFYADLPGASVLFQNDRVIFTLKDKNKPVSAEQQITMQLIGANINPVLFGQDKIAGRLNHIISDGKENTLQLNQYKSILYSNIYPGIDLLFKLQENGLLKYDFIVHPGADPKHIRIRWNGVENTLHQADGSLAHISRNQKIVENKPVTLTEDKKQVFSSYKVDAEGIVRFNIGEYDVNQKLIIDPVIQWSTYYGSYSPYEFISKVLPDRFGNVYALMREVSEYDDRLITPAFDSIKWAMSSVNVIVKFDSSGNRSWASFLPQSIDMSVDDSGNVYLLSDIDSGSQNRISYPESWYRLVTKNTYQTKVTGINDLLIIKLDSAGYLKWGTLYGGKDLEYVNTIYVKNGYVYISGQTNSDDNIATVGHGSRSLPDAFVAKLSVDGKKRDFGVYIAGAAGNECVSDIAVDDSGNVYVCGSTTAKSGIATSGAYQSRPGSSSLDNWDGYLIKYNKDGIKQWGTYYHNKSEFDIVKNVSVDKNGNVYIFSSSPIAKSKNSWENSDSCFITRFDSTGKRIWEARIKDSLYVVFQPYQYYFSYKRDGSQSWMQLDENGNIVIGGYIIDWKGYYHGIVPTADALKKKPEGGEGYLLIYNSAGQRKYASYFGGKYHDEIRFAAPDAWGGIYLGGKTYGNDIHTKGAYDTTSQFEYGPYADGFLARLKFDLTEEAGLVNVKAGSIKSVCENTNTELKFHIKNHGWKKIDSLKINWSIDNNTQAAFNWKGFVPAGDSVIYSFKAPLLKAGTHKAKIWITNGDVKNDTITFSFTVDSLPAASAGKNIAICAGEKATLGLAARSNYKYLWSNRSGFTDTTAQPVVSPWQTTTYHLTVTNRKTDCTTSDSVTITVNPLPNKSAGADKTICAGESVKLGDTAQSNYKYHWFTSSGIIDSIAQPIVSPTTSTTYYLTVTDSTGCTMHDTVEVTVNPLPAMQSISGQQAICKNGFSWYSYKRNSNETLNWQVSGATFTGNANADSIFIKWDSAGIYTLNLVVANAAFCKDSATLNVKIFGRNKPSFSVSANEACINDPVIFTSTTPASTGLEWIIPGTKTDTLPSVTKAFSEPGIYVIWLKSTTENGCADSVKQEIVIHAMPESGWEISSSKAGVYNFKATDSLQSFYRWYFGNGDSSTVSNSNYIYKQDGKYLVSLKIRTANGCEIKRDTLLIVTGIISVAESKAESIDINVFPNPFRNKLYVSYYLQQAVHVNISLYDMNGKIHVLKPAIKQAAGRHNTELDLSGNSLPGGIYLLKLETNNTIVYRRLVKME